MNSNPRSGIAAGVLLGVGMGGFLDGIVFHQVLQTHSLLSARLPKTSITNIEVNMFWYGLFHLFTWLTTLAGVIALWRAGRSGPLPSARVAVGSMLMGWGLFNLVEGLIDHHLLQLHHVVERLGVSIFDYLFLASGVLFLVAGWMTVKSGQRNIGEPAWPYGAARKPV